jgi:hypothetical protein
MGLAIVPAFLGNARSQARELAGSPQKSSREQTKFLIIELRLMTELETKPGLGSSKNGPFQAT